MQVDPTYGPEDFQLYENQYYQLIKTQIVFSVFLAVCIIVYT